MSRNGLANGQDSIQTVTCAKNYCRDTVKSPCPRTMEDAMVLSEMEPRNKTEEDTKAFRPTDGGWGWVVCLASFWTNGTLFGVMNCFGVLYVNLEKKFAETHHGDAAFLTCKSLNFKIKNPRRSPVAMLPRVPPRIHLISAACRSVLTT